MRTSLAAPEPPDDDMEQFARTMEAATRQMSMFGAALVELSRPFVAAMNKLTLQLPQPPVRGRPCPLAADGLSYHRRYLARKRRRS